MNSSNNNLFLVCDHILLKRKPLSLERTEIEAPYRMEKVDVLVNKILGPLPDNIPKHLSIVLVVDFSRSKTCLEKF